MSTQSDTGAELREDKRAPRGGELILPLLALVFTLYYISTIIDSPWTAQVNAVLIGSILLVVIALFFVRFGIEFLRGEASFGIGNLLKPYDQIKIRLCYIGIILAYLMAIENGVGFTISTFLFLASSMMLLNKGKNKRFTLLLATALSLVGYGVFIVAFETRFPAGPFELMMKGLM